MAQAQAEVQPNQVSSSVPAEASALVESSNICQESLSLTVAQLCEMTQKALQLAMQARKLF